MVQKVLQYSFLLFACLAILFACSKKDDGIVTFKVDKTTSTTGAYNGDKQIGSASTTSVTSPVQQNVTLACTPEKNTFIPSDYEGIMQLNNAELDVDNELTARCNTGDIFIMFYNEPKVDHYYTTASRAFGYNVSIQVNTIDGRIWTPDDNQTLYVKVDQATGLISATMCDMHFSAQADPYTNTKVYFTAQGNVTAKKRD